MKYDLIKFYCDCESTSVYDCIGNCQYGKLCTGRLLNDYFIEMFEIFYAEGEV